MQRMKSCMNIRSPLQSHLLLDYQAYESIFYVASLRQTMCILLDHRPL